MSLNAQRLASFVPSYFLLGLATLAVVLLITFVSKRFYEDTENNPVLIRKGSDLLKQAAEWTFSAQQTDNPLLALSHTNYATAYLNLARNLASDKDLTDFTKIPVNDLRDDVKKEEEKARERILKMCPQAGDKGRVAAYVGFHGTGAQQPSVSPAPSYVRPQIPNQPQRPAYQTATVGSTVLQTGGFGPLAGQSGSVRPPVPTASMFSTSPQQQQAYPVTYRVM